MNPVDLFDLWRHGMFLFNVNVSLLCILIPDEFFMFSSGEIVVVMLSATSTPGSSMIFTGVTDSPSSCEKTRMD